MSEDNGPVILVCARLGMLDKLIAGYTISRCIVCEHKITVAPSSHKMIRERGAKLICIECTLERAEQEEIQFKMPTPEQIQEIQENLENGA